jgi:very-short-patch-repair endonuclease
VHKLEQDFSFEMSELQDELDAQGFETYLEELRAAIAKLPEATVQTESYLGLFSFSRITMYQDLVRCSQTLLGHPVAGSLAGLPPAQPIPSLDFSRSASLDEHIDPRSTFQVLDADSSQQETLLAARCGAHMVIQGPPGTGKSQTIANLIAEGLADGKKILFVSEKAAALEVVRRRLDECGVAAACLDLHSHKVDKKRILNELESTLYAAAPGEPRSAERVQQSLVDVREQLNSYVRELHKPRFASELTAYQVQGQLAKLDRAPKLAFIIDNIISLAHRDTEHRATILRTLVGHADIIDDISTHSWRGLRTRPPSFAFRDEMETHLCSLLEIARDLDQRIGILVELSGLAWPRSGPVLAELFSLFGKYRLTVLHLPVEDLRRRFEERHCSSYRYFLPSYWKDVLLLKAHCRANWSWSYSELLADVLKLDRAFQLLGTGHGSLDDGALWERLSAMDEPLGGLRGELDYMASQFQGGGAFEPQALRQDLQSLEAWCTEHLDALDRTDEYLRYAQDYDQAVQGGLGSFLTAAIVHQIPARSWPDAYHRGFCQAWLDRAAAQTPALANFSRAGHEVKIQRFRELDKEQLDVARQVISARLAAARPRINNFVQEHAASAEISILVREFRKKRRIKPLRKLLREAPRVIQALKPCFMMSPLSVSQFLDPECFQFNMVIFDEASQVKVEDAVGCIFRGEQVVVAGDRQQLPPTRFFDALTTEEEWSEEDGATMDSDAYESILDALSAMPTVLANKTLLWHYRSRHEALIAFSNKNFYNWELYTFPNPNQAAGTISAVEFVHVPNGIYEPGAGRRRNPVEARKVVDLVLRHARERSSWSLAVITFSEAQREAISQELEKALEKKPELRPFFQDVGSEPFRVKNLELIQGDERDAIIFSTGYGPDAPGRPPRLNFGPLNKEGGRRRLNVAVTRARQHVTVVSSMLPEDLARSENEGVRLLREYMALARDGLGALAEGTGVGNHGEVESPFEASVYAALSARGLEVHPQVGCSGYRIDLAVVDPQNPARYCLGVECDGATYHSARTARDRDRLRQQVLERLDWNIHRIWSRDWVANPEREIQLVLEAVARHAGGNGLDVSSDPTERQTAEAPPSIPVINSAAPPLSVATQQYVSGQELPEGVVHYELGWLPLEGKWGGYHRYSVADDVKKVVDAFGPLHRRVVVQHISACWGFMRTSKKIQEAIKAGIDLAVSQRKVRTSADGLFLWPLAYGEVKPRVPHCYESPRDLEEVCIEEIAAAIHICVEHSGGSISRGDLVGLVVRLFGHQRATERLARPVETALDVQLANGRLVSTNGTIHIAQMNGS